MASLLEQIVENPKDFNPAIVNLLRDPRAYTAILANEPARYFFEESDKEFWDQREEFRNLAPPFDVTWVEFDHPKFIKSDVHGIKPWPNEAWRKAGILLYSLPPELWSATGLAKKFTTAKWIIKADIYVEGEEYYTKFVKDLGFEGDVVNAIQIAYGVEEDGTLAPIAGDDINCFDVTLSPKLDKAIRTRYSQEQIYKILKTVSDTMFPVLDVAMLSVYLMHAAGTQLIPKQVPPKLAKAKKKKGKEVVPQLRFKILDLGLGMRQSMAQAKSEGLGLSRALHLRRGHFRHYTKPMFGKGKLGDVWVRPHKVGTPKKGEIIKSYKPPKIEDTNLKRNPDDSLRQLERVAFQTEAASDVANYWKATLRTGDLPKPNRIGNAESNIIFGWVIDRVGFVYLMESPVYPGTPEIQEVTVMIRFWAPMHPSSYPLDVDVLKNNKENIKEEVMKRLPLLINAFETNLSDLKRNPNKPWSKANLNKRAKEKSLYPIDLIDEGNYAIISTENWSWDPFTEGEDLINQNADPSIQDAIEELAGGRALNGAIYADIGKGWAVLSLDWRRDGDVRRNPNEEDDFDAPVDKLTAFQDNQPKIATFTTLSPKFIEFETKLNTLTNDHEDYIKIEFKNLAETSSTEDFKIILSSMFKILKPCFSQYLDPETEEAINSVISPTNEHRYPETSWNVEIIEKKIITLTHPKARGLHYFLLSTIYRKYVSSMLTAFNYCGINLFTGLKKFVVEFKNQKKEVVDLTNNLITGLQNTAIKKIIDFQNININQNQKILNKIDVIDKSNDATEIAKATLEKLKELEEIDKIKTTYVWKELMKSPLASVVDETTLLGIARTALKKLELTKKKKIAEAETIKSTPVWQEVIKSPLANTLDEKSLLDIAKTALKKLALAEKKKLESAEEKSLTKEQQEADKINNLLAELSNFALKNQIADFGHFLHTITTHWLQAWPSEKNRQFIVDELNKLYNLVDVSPNLTTQKKEIIKKEITINENDLMEEWFK